MVIFVHFLPLASLLQWELWSLLAHMSPLRCLIFPYGLCFACAPCCVLAPHGSHSFIKTYLHTSQHAGFE